MPLTKIQLRPGLVRDTTSYANEGGWYYCNKIRFRSGSPESIGGWVRASTDTYLGTCTALMPWASLTGAAYCAVGTNLKYYVEYGSQLFDITPIRSTTNPLGNNPIATSNGLAVLTITDTGHGAGYGDYVTLSGATGPIAGIPAAEINAEHSITRVVDANTYEITVTTSANAATTGGGAAVVAEYQLSVGLAYQVAGTGWGASVWQGDGFMPAGLQVSWGETTTPTISGSLRVWTQAAFGEDLLFCARDAEIYYWDSSGGTGARAVYLTDVGGASDVPTIACCVLVTDSRHVVALGCNPLGSAVQDPLMVRWADSESIVDWTPTATNTAGGQRLTVGTKILGARNSRVETLIWTDAALYSMSYIGGDLEFGFQQIGTPISILGPNAMAVVGGTAYWLGHDKFYMYNGTVQTLSCPLIRMLIDNINHEQEYQIFAGTNEQFTEVTWFYCSTGSLTVDSYITYNYNENIWYFGTLARSAWADSGIRSNPMAADNVNNVLVYHEQGVDDNSTGIPSAINSYIESSDFDLGDGHQFMFISRIIPDVSFEGSTAATPQATITLKTRNSPGSTWATSSNQPSASTITSTELAASIFTSPIEEYTPQAWVRLRGRQAAFRIESNAVGVKWQLGALRLDIRPDGRR